MGTVHLQNQSTDEVAATLQPSSSPRTMRKRLLLVESNHDRLAMLAQASRWVATVDSYSDFAAARRRLLADPPDLLVTNIRLGAYNGLHLVHLAAASGFATRTIVYTDAPDPVLLREAQEAGA